jgi:putative membrane protein
MKKFIVLLLVAGIVACNSSSNKDSVDAAKDSNENKIDSSNMSSTDTTSNASTGTIAVDKEDADFAVGAANGSMMEVEMGKLAQSKATNERVKNFATMMITDHSKAGDDLKKVAVAKNITLPADLSDDAKKRNGKAKQKKQVKILTRHIWI